MRDVAHRLWSQGRGDHFIARELGITRHKARTLVAEFEARGPQDGAVLSVRGDEATVEAPRSRIRTLEELLAAARVDLDVWMVERWVANTWESASRGPDGTVHVEPLAQVKCWLRRRVPEATEARLHAIRDAAVEVMRAAGRETRTGTRKRVVNEHRDGLLLELAVPDLHAGKWAMAEETGGRYDLDTAEAAFRSAVTDALEKAKRFPIARALFLVGNDLLHVDNSENTTTRGTRQDVDGRWQLAFRRALTLMLWAIDELRALGVPVDVLTVPGNHAAVLEQAIGEALAARYILDDDVSVDASVRPRKPYVWGQVLLGFAHGHNEKHADLPLLMASEWPELWGATTVREVHVGHLHHRRATRSSFARLEELAESKGVTVRILPSLSGTDSWHAKAGYVGAMKACEAYLWDRDRGLEVLVTGHPA